MAPPTHGVRCMRMGHAPEEYARKRRRRRKQHGCARNGRRKVQAHGCADKGTQCCRTKRAGGSCTDQTHRFRDSPFGGAGAGLAARSRFSNDAFRFLHMLKIMNGPRGT